MNDLVTVAPQGEPIMTSRQIADYLEIRHDSVKRAIERLAERSVIVRPPLVDEQVEDVIGRPRVEWVFHIGKRDSLVVAAQLSPPFTAMLVDRWQELEEAVQMGKLLAPAQIDYSDPKVMLGFMTHLQSQVGEKSALLTAQQPRIEALEVMEASTGSVSLTEAAKMLNQKPKAFMSWLSNVQKWTYRKGGRGNWVAMQTKLDAGLMTSSPHTHRDSYGIDHTTYQALVTPKGLAKLAEIVAALPDARVPD